MRETSLNQNAVEVPITGIEQTAILLLSMGETMAAKVLQCFSRDDVVRLTRQMANMSGVSTDEAKWILTQFFDLYRKQSGISSASRDYLEKTLDLALGDKLGRSMLDSIYGDQVSRDIQRLQWVAPAILAKFFIHEHPQMQAVILAFLPPTTASAVLASLPKPGQDDLLLRVANLTEVSEFVINDLKETLERCLEFVAEQSGAKVDGARQVADIINCYSGSRSELIDMLRLNDPETADQIEENMYDFFALGRQSAEVIEEVIQQVPTELMAVALKGADKSFCKTIFGSMPKRMAQALESDIKVQGAVPVSRVENARIEIMKEVRELSEAGDLNFQLFQEPVVS
jgi:flagellar motor switch protein FliG